MAGEGGRMRGRIEKSQSTDCLFISFQTKTGSLVVFSVGQTRQLLTSYS